MKDCSIVTNLSSKELSVIKAVYVLKEASVLVISKKTGIKRTTIYNFIDDLVSNRLLIEGTINGKSRYTAPKKTIKWLEIDENSKREDNRHKNFQILTSKYALKMALSETLGSNDKKVDWLVGAPETTNYLGARFIERYIEKSIELSVKVRALRSPLTKPWHKYGGEEAILAHGRIMRRANANLPFKTTFTIHDDTLIFVSSDKGGVGYKIIDKEMAESFRYIYNGLWKYSKVIGEEQY